MLDDVTDGVTIRRRSATWRWVLSVVVAALLLAGLVALIVRLRDDRSARTVAAVTATAVLAAAAVALSWWESRRIARHLHRTIDRLIETEAELRLLLDELPDGVVALDDKGRINGVNAKVAELAGCSAAQLAGVPIAELTDDAHRPELTAWLGAVRGDAGTVAFPLRRPDGSSVLIEADAEPTTRDGAALVVRLHDVTEREDRLRALEQARRRFQQAFHSAPTGMALVRLDDSVIVDANRSLAEMLDRPVDELVGRSIREITHPDDLRAASADRARLAIGVADAYLMDQRYLRPDGEFIWARTRVAVTEDEGVALAITHIEDVTEQRRTAELLQWAATHDELTGLPNRTELLRRVDALLADAEPGDVALLFVDLDHFKAVNDSLGHGIGDTLLAAMSVRLRDTVGSTAVLARFGGDEFVIATVRPDREGGHGGGAVVEAVIDPDAEDRLDSHVELAERVREALGRPVVVEGTEMFVSASIGFTLNHDPAATASDLLRDADAAMYRAKARGRNCVEAFAPGTHETTVLALRTANELRRGLERDEVVPYFQPIVELTTGHVVGFESLARWRHPERGLLGPDQFLPMAEETGLVGVIGAGVLRDSLAQFARWRARDLPFARRATVSVNVSSRQLVDPGFAGLVAELLAETGMPADALWLEITESALLADVKASTVALRNLRSLGLHLAVDDFGTGYSSLTYLKRFPLEALKIDRSFVAGLGLDTEDTTIVEAVINLGHSFGISVVAEGLETPLQLARLRELGCDRGQGYLFGRPRPAHLVETERADADPQRF
ncbi:MAG: putative bifunctional diguanylate cyclase/phosphodiesterase [Desertimonas sp.]